MRNRNCSNYAFFWILIRKRNGNQHEKGTFRVDVDALFSQNRIKFGVGVIVRNSEDRIVVAMAKHMAAVTTVFHGELMAIVAGIVLCKQENIHPTFIFTDSLHAVRVIAGSGNLSKMEEFFPVTRLLASHRTSSSLRSEQQQ